MTQTATTLAKAPTKPKGNGVRELSVKVFEDANGEPINAITKVTRNGTIQAMFTKVPMSVEAGELYYMGAMVDEKWNRHAKVMITALGFEKANTYIGYTIHQPETVLDDGGAVRPNPYMIRDEHGQLVGCKIRLQALGRNPVGSIVMADNTLLLDVATYFAQDLWSKWTGNKKDSAKAWGDPYALGFVPDEILKNPKILKCPCPNGVVLCVDMNHKEVTTILGERLNRVKFIERTARTICKRNLIRGMIGRATPIPRRNDKGEKIGWCLPVVSWPIADRELGDFAELADSVKNGKAVIDGEVIDVTATSEVVSDPDDVNATMEEVLDENDAPQEDQPDEPTAGIDPSDAQPTGSPDEAAGYRETIRSLAPKLSKKRFAKLLKDHGFADMSDVANCDDSLENVEALGELASSLQTEAGASKAG